MTNLRTALTALVVALLVFGWGGAAFAAMDAKPNAAKEWATRLDGPDAGPIRLLALVVLLAALVLAFVPDREPEG